MDGRGVNVVAFLKADGELSTLRVCPMNGGLVPAIPMWVNNYLFDRDKEGNPVKHWINLQKDPTKINYIIKEMESKSKMKLRKIDFFQANGNLVSVKDLYPGYKNYYCMFRTVGNSWKLCVVGSKGLDEYLAARLNSGKESFLPLIVVKVNDSFQILNHI